MQLSVQGIRKLRQCQRDRLLGMQATTVLMVCLENTEWQNRVMVGRKDIARALEMDPADVAKALKLLVTHEFLEAPETRHAPYKVSPRFAWVGSVQDLRIALSERAMLDPQGFMTSAAA